MKTNRRLLSALMAAVMIITMIPFGLVASAEDETVYTISSAAELVAFANSFNGVEGSAAIANTITTVQLTADIDMSTITDWTAIGSESKPFNLIFDGQGYAIKNLVAEGTKDTELGGIFAYVSGTIEDLAIVDCSFDYTSKVGAIAANVTKTGVIQRCASYNTEVTIKIDSDALHPARAGGLVGNLAGGTINESYSKANVYISDPYGINYAGGLVAYAEDGSTITNSYYAGNMASVTGVYNVAGGIVGRACKATIMNCYVAGLVTGEISGAIVGWANKDSSDSSSDTTFTNNYYYSDSNIYAFQYSSEENYTGEVGNAVASASELTATTLNGEAFKEVTTLETARTDGYAFPILVNNSFDDKNDSPAINEEFAGGRGTLYSPYEIENADQLAKVKNYLNSAFVLKNDITLSGTFTPIGSASKPFVGSFDGAGNSIKGLVVNSTGEKAAMFINNFGVIKNFTLTEIAKVVDNTTDPVTETPAVLSSVTLDTSALKSYAAAIAVENYGRISNVNSDASVTITSNQLHASAAGIVALNYGVVENCTNTGNILIDNTEVVSETGIAYKTVAETADINVAGLVAINNVGGTVSGKSSDTSRSVITSVAGSNKIDQAQYVAENNSGSEPSVSSADATYGTFMFTDLDASLTHGTTKLSKDENPITSLGTCKVTLNGETVSASPEIDYTDLANNYQQITLTYTISGNIYKVVFFRWIDYTDFTVDSSSAKKSFFLGDDFSSTGLVVEGKTSDNTMEELDEVDSAEANGYQVKIFDKSTGTQVSDEDLAAGTYVVKLYYYGEPIKVLNEEASVKEEFSYEINVYTITSLSVDLKGTTTYLQGTTPDFRVKAVYNDPDQTTKTVGTKYYSYVLSTSEPEDSDYVAASDEDSAHTFSGAGTYYVYVKYGDIYGKSDAITVISSSTTVDADSFKATVCKADNEVQCDNVQLDWSFTGANSDNVTFKIERKRILDATKYDSLTYEEILDAVGTLEYTTVKSGVTGTTYTDTKTEAGEEYDYRITVEIGGVACSSSTTIEGVEPAEPVNYTFVAPTGKNKYFALGSDFKHKGLEVNAVYVNGSYEEIEYSESQTNEILKYYLVTSFDKTTAGQYKVYIKHCTDPGWFGIGVDYEYLIDDDEDKSYYTVEVLNPTSVKSASAKYTYYPEGYSKENFLKTLTVKLEYLNPENLDETIATQKVEDPSTDSHITLDGYASNTLNTKESVNVKYDVCTGDEGQNIDVTFVEKGVPTVVTATAQTDGTVDVEFNEVAGAVSYNIYRSTSADGDDYTLVATKTHKSDLDVTEESLITGTDESDTIVAGTIYYYKVAAVIADEECSKSVASNAVKSAVPEYYVIDASDAKNIFATGYKFSSTGLDVYAYYNINAGTDKEAEYEKKSIKSRNYTVTCADTDDDGIIQSAGVKNVTVTINNKLDGLKVYTSNEKTAEFTGYTVTAYDLAAIQATVKKEAYPLNYEFSKSDIRLKAIYGDASTLGTSNEIVAKRKTISADDEGYLLTVEPDTSKAGTQTATVTYGGMTANVDVNIYNPNAVLSVEATANNTSTISLTIDTNRVKFVKSYTVTRSTSYDMDENVETITVTPGDDHTSVVENFFEYIDTGVEKNKQYYYTVTPVFLDKAVGVESAVVGVKTVAEIVAITPASDVGVTRSDNILTISPTSKNGVTVETLLGTDLTNNAECMKVFKSDGKTEYTGTVIATGCVIKLYAADDTAFETSKDQVTVVVKGDVSGDGKITALDAKKTLDVAGKVQGVSLSGAYELAANVDGKSGIKALDAKKILDFAGKVITEF